MLAKLASVVLLAPLALASILPRLSPVFVQCGTLNSTRTANINAGIPPILSFETVVSFGDEWSVSDPVAATTWVDVLAKYTSAKLLNYAAPGAVIDKTIWPGTSFPGDFVTQANTHIGEHRQLDPATTLYTVFFGINDFAQSERGDPENLQLAAQALIYKLVTLTSSPSFAKNILVLDMYGLGRSSAIGDKYKQSVFDGVKAIRRLIGTNVAFADLSNLHVTTPSAGVHGAITQYVRDVLQMCIT